MPTALHDCCTLAGSPKHPGEGSVPVCHTNVVDLKRTVDRLMARVVVEICGGKFVLGGCVTQIVWQTSN